MDSVVLNQILTVGARAMSPYNSQPWRFRYVPGGVEIYILRTKNFYLKLRGVSQMVFGCFLENLSDGAAAAGYRVEQSIWPESVNLDTPIAKVVFERAGDVDPERLRGINARNTNRRDYSREPLSAADAQFLSELMPTDPSRQIKMSWVTGEKKHLLADVFSDLELVRGTNPKIFFETLESLRLTPEERSQKRTGLAYDAIPTLSPSLLRYLRIVRRHRWLFSSTVAPFKAGYKERSRNNLESCAGVLVYLVDSGSPSTYVELGRMCQRHLNLLAARGLQSQSILSGIYLLHSVFENLEIFSSHERDVLFTAMRDLELGLGLMSRNIAYVVRLGYAPKFSFSNPRRPIEELLLPPLPIAR